jgi:hypothetical protein
VEARELGMDKSVLEKPRGSLKHKYDRKFFLIYSGLLLGGNEVKGEGTFGRVTKGSVLNRDGIQSIFTVFIYLSLN